MEDNGNGTGGALAAPCSDRAVRRVDGEGSINHKAILSRGVGYRPAVAGDWRDDRVGSAHRGENPLVMARMRGGFAVIGDTQHLPGYSLLLSDDPSVNHLTDLDWERRTQFLFDLSLLGEAVGLACRDNGLRRINYEVLGNSLPILHGHVTLAMSGSRRTGSTGRYGDTRRMSGTIRRARTRRDPRRVARSNHGGTERAD